MSPTVDGRPAERRQAPGLGRAGLAVLLAPFVLAAVAVLIARKTQAHSHASDENPPRPYAVIYPPEGTAPLQVRLDGSGSTDDVGVTEYRWDFGDGTSGEGMIVDHLFASAGTYRIRLEALDAAGNARSKETLLTVAAPSADHAAPVAKLTTSSLRGTAPLGVDFDASASTDDRGVTAWDWTFDDGSTGSGSRVHHDFALPGSYTATLRLRDAAGHRTEVRRRVRVDPGPPSAPPQAAMTVSAHTAEAPATIDFSAAGSHDDRGIVLYSWDFGDGESGQGPVVHHRYGHAGTFVATVTVYDDSGQRDRAWTRLEIREPPVVSEKVLFDDDYAPGVREASWGLVAKERQTVHAGAQAIAVVPGRNGAFRLEFAPTTLDAFDRVGFWIDGREIERVSMRAMLTDGHGEHLGPPVPLRDHLLAGAGGALESVWRHGTVSLAALGDGHQRVTGLVWQAPDDDRPAPFFLDDIALLPPDVRLPVLSDCARPPPVEGFVTREGSSLQIEGLPFRSIGANMYYLQQKLAEHLQTGEVRPLADVREALDAASCAGVTVIRMIGFNDNPPGSNDHAVIQTAPGVYREEGLRGLDLALAEAHAHHLRVILTLTNNWAAFGGLPRYAEWAHVPPEEAVHTAQIREWVAGYARMLSNRVNVFTGVTYRDDPTIFAVELVNELRCKDCVPGDDATSFQLALAHDVALAFPHHLIADGGEGFDDDPALYPGLRRSTTVSGDEGTSFHQLAESPDIDLVSYHLYPDEWGLKPKETVEYIDRHEEIAREAGKVAYLGEFGEQTLDDDRASTYDHWLSRLFLRDQGALALVWQVTYPGRLDNDGFALIPGESMEAIASLARYAHALTMPGLEGVDLAGR